MVAQYFGPSNTLCYLDGPITAVPASARAVYGVLMHMKNPEVVINPETGTMKILGKGENPLTVTKDIAAGLESFLTQPPKPQ